MAAQRTLLKNGCVLSLDPKVGNYKQADVLLEGSQIAAVGPSLGAAPLFGIEGERPDYYDFSIGGRVSVWRDTVIAFANAVIPLNDAGIRTGVIPLAGVEVAF